MFGAISGKTRGAVVASTSDIIKVKARGTMRPRAELRCFFFLLPAYVVFETNTREDHTQGNKRVNERSRKRDNNRDNKKVDIFSGTKKEREREKTGGAMVRPMSNTIMYRRRDNAAGAELRWGLFAPCITSRG